MRIQVLRDFAGKLTSEKRIFPGFYESDDPVLFGVAQYLLDNGFAVPSTGYDFTVEVSDAGANIPDGATVILFQDEDTAADAVDYSTWTVSALKDELEARGIDIMALEGSGANGNLLKEDLVLVLQGDDADDAEEE